MLRIDLVERIARTAHDARGKERTSMLDPAMAVSLGIGSETFARIMRAIGFHPVGNIQANQWRWRGRPRRVQAPTPVNAAFAVLGQLKR